MNLWIIFAVMSLGAVAFAIVPLYRKQRRLSPLIAFSVILVVGLSSSLYYRQGNPQLPSARSGDGGLQSMDDAIAGLQAKLADNPNNPNGWMMLGRTYMSTGNFPGAIEAYEKAVELQSAQDAQGLVGLGEALMAAANGDMGGRATSLFENALALDPNYPQALFYGGLAAFHRDDVELAADRWERLLALNPPPEIEEILRQRVAEWRGEETALPASHPPVDGGEDATAMASDAPRRVPAPGEAPPMSEGAVVRANVSLSPEAAAALPAEATVFLIARDPAQPMPPIAATRRMLSELPALIELGDRESMVPGRDLSGFAEFELVARVSLSGQPMAAPGDWFGTVVVDPSADNDIELSIQTEVQ